MTNDRHIRVKELFLAACQLPDDEQEAWIEQQCADDPQLLAEVQSLLDHHATQTIVARPTVFDTKPAPPPRSTTETPFDSMETTRFFHYLNRRMFGKDRKSNLIRAFLLAGLLVALLAAWVHLGTKQALQEMLLSELQTLLESNVAALNLFIEDKRLDADLWARQPSIRQAATSLADASRTATDPRELILASEAYQQLQQTLGIRRRGDADAGYFLVDQDRFVLASDREPTVGRRLTVAQPKKLAQVFDGQTVVVMPSPEGLFSTLEEDDATPFPTVWIMTPVVREGVAEPENADIVAALCVGHRADGEFSQVLLMSRSGRSGETYVFNRAGTMLSASRFDDQLRRIGLIPDEKDASAIFHVEVRDPGRNLIKRSPEPGELADSVRPLTMMAAKATIGRSGANIAGYRDYRGVPVIGAWQWLEDYDIGITTEVDYEEAYAPLWYPITAIWASTAAFGLTLLGLFLAALRFAHAKPAPGRAAPQELGQYTLKEKIGEGGIGVVYKARHSMLQRPTAIKLLKPEAMTSEAKARFEREVQLATRLTHPNTIDIYDYGSTDEGVFYYAMEYLDGLSLAALIDMEGALPQERVMHILKQICGSLGEAHDVGLVHRDIKPLNIMLCERGGMKDFVKVLDFGLVKQVEEAHNTEITAPMVVHGTPMYIAPERIRDTANTDIRSDIYSMGAVAFNLITGRHVFTADNEVELLYQVMNEPPPHPTSVTQQPIMARLSELIHACLAKSPDDRPQSASVIRDRLEELENECRWTQSDAVRWWEANAERIAAHRAASAHGLRETEGYDQPTVQQNTPLSDVDLGPTISFDGIPLQDGPK